MSTTIERIKIVIYAIYIHLANKLRSKPHNGRVLMLFQQVFGDSIILLPALEGYVELYHRRRGMEVTLACRSSILAFLQETAKTPKELNIVTIDYKRLVNDFNYFKKIVHQYRDFAEVTIVPGSSLSAELLSSTLNSKERHGLISCFRTKWPPQMVLFQRLAYTDAVIPPVGSMMIQRHRIMLNHLGLTDYKGHLSSLLPQKRIIAGKYCVLCPGASTTVKMWPIERFAELADWIIETYGLEVYLCGGKPERGSSDKLITLSRHPEHIYNKVGETGFVDWSAIVQHAQIVIGNDSATLHIAAATQTSCICVAGVYDKFQFFPYRVDELRKGERLPLTLFVDRPCAYCRTKGYFAGYGNPECKRAIKYGKPALCVSAVSVEQVEIAVKELMESISH